jgi:colanic acid/amylovoran biosynthesis protein
LPGNVRVVNEKNPLKIKGLIKQFDFVVSSRFHALVSSLSQGIPAIGTGWSHKYQILLEEYGCSNCLLRATSSEEEIIAVLNNFFEPSILLDLKKTIAASALQQKQLVQRMWDEVKEILEQ